MMRSRRRAADSHGSRCHKVFAVCVNKKAAVQVGQIASYTARNDNDSFACQLMVSIQAGNLSAVDCVVLV